SVWLAPERAPLRWLPIELTLINELPVVLDYDRTRVKVSKDGEPDLFLYYMDGNTGFQERDGFWVMGKSQAEIVMRAERPLLRLQLKLMSRVPNQVEISIAGRSTSVTLQPNVPVTIPPIRPKDGMLAF